jgi:hypothetical protein
MVLLIARHKVGLLPGGCSRAIFSQAKAKVDYQAQVHSDQMVFMIVRRDAGPVVKNESKKTLKVASGPNRKQLELQPKIRVCLLFLMGR